MKNITLTLPEKVLTWARIKAATLGISTSKMISQMLISGMEDDGEYQAAKEKYFSIKPSNLSSGGTYPKRDDLYDR
jgi:hypothetical protein